MTLSGRNGNTAGANVRRTLEQVAAGALSIEHALEQLATAPAAAAVGDFAVVDHDRAARCGFAEVVFCDGKEPSGAAAIAAEILARSPRVLLTRATPAHCTAVLASCPDAVVHERARCIAVDRAPLPRAGTVAVVAAGTADLPVADEAAVTAALAGCAVERVTDVGVAGLHRLLEHLARIRTADVVLAVAGMDGALPSVVGGLVDQPVIAVPTSVGYGTGLGGVAALMTMLNACAAGVAVVNIDNGFGAGYLAARICRRTASPASRDQNGSP